MYPRPLRPKERDLIDSVLPLDRPGYRRLRERLAAMQVVGEGRRGEGDLLLGVSGAPVDLSGPLAPVLAYGAVETTREEITITVREPVDDVVGVEIVSTSGGEVPDHFEEKRRWTYSDWLPGRPSPHSGEVVRSVAVDGKKTLGIARGERRLWIHDDGTGMVIPLPVTNFYNELMLLRRVRDPAIALRSALLFERLDDFTDEELRDAFVAYNAIRKRVDLGPTVPAARTTGAKGFFRRLLGG